MIFDWKENCEEILKTKHFPMEDGYERRVIQRQHLVLFKYLRNMGWTYDQIFEFWKTTDSIFFSALPTSDEDVVKAEFQTLWDQSKYVIVSAEKSKAKYDFPIYKSEVEFISKMTCEKWVKKYVFVWLCYYKHANTKYVKFNNTENAWILKMISRVKQNNTFVEISKLYRKYKIFECCQAQGGIVPLYRLTFVATEGEVAATIHSAKDADKFFYLIPSLNKKCTRCGNLFYPSARGKTNVCPECQAKKQLEKKEKYEEWKTCPQCGTRFQLSFNSRRKIGLDLCDACYQKARKRYKADFFVKNYQKTKN